ncbi:MAG: hypothetical protein HZC36_14980 [Armatimonadetes bacterium]|nr:hypothetical protein [Armatimonadota bacterium]
MKRNVTISLDEVTLRLAREYAARQGKSFQEFARELFERTVLSKSQPDEAWEFFKIADRLNLSVGDWKMSRDELYKEMLAPSTPKESKDAA